MRKMIMTQSDDDSKQEEPQGAIVDRPHPKIRQNILLEFLYFIKTEKKFWLIPILVLLGVLGVLILVGNSSFAPFLYPLF